MRKSFFLLLLSLVCLSLYAKEQPNIIKGRIVEADGSPVMYASAYLVSGKKILTGALTDTLGAFIIQGQFEGKYDFKVSLIGYEDTVQVLNLKKGEKLDLGDIVVKQNGILLEGVVVEGEAASKNVCEILRKYIFVLIIFKSYD